MIAIIDYGMGNLGSVQKALAFLGYDSEITDDPSRVMDADGVILPGVGAIGAAMEALSSKGLDKVVHEYIATGKPFLGICLGMQMLFDSSEESFGGEPVKGLSVLPGKVVRRWWPTASCSPAAMCARSRRSAGTNSIRKTRSFRIKNMFTSYTPTTVCRKEKKTSRRP